MHPNYEEFNLEFIPLTYIHIGTGIEYDPVSYIIKNQKLYRFNLEKLLKCWDNKKKEEFNSIVEKNDFIKIKNFIRNNFIEKVADYKIAVDKNIEEKYIEKFDSSMNYLSIEENIKNKITNIPYIPGSSIKGSIRTAILNFLELFYKGRLNYNSRYYESDLLESKNKYGKFDAKRDPFRFVLVGDCNFEDKEILNVKEIKNFVPIILNMEKGIKNIDITKEVINYGTSGKFSIKINKKMFELKTIKSFNKRKRREEIVFPETKNKIDINYIRDKCNLFFKAIFQYEYNKFYKPLMNWKIELKEFYQELSEKIERLNRKNEFLIKVGRFSQIEAVTFNKNFRPEVQKYGISRGLVDGRYPLGWAIVRIKNSEKLKEPDLVSLDNYSKKIGELIKKKIYSEDYILSNSQFMQNKFKNDNFYNKNNDYFIKKGENNFVHNNFKSKIENLKKELIQKNNKKPEIPDEVNEKIEKLMKYKGKIVDGEITNIKSYGVFVNIGKISDGLLNKKNIRSYKLPQLKVGQFIKVRVDRVYYDDEKKRIIIELSE